MSEAKNKRSRYRAHLRRSMIRASVPAAPSSGEPQERADRLSGPSSQKTLVSQAPDEKSAPKPRVHTQEMPTTDPGSQLSGAASLRSENVKSSRGLSGSDVALNRDGSSTSTASESRSPSPRSTPTQGTARVAAPDELPADRGVAHSTSRSGGELRSTNPSDSAGEVGATNDAAVQLSVRTEPARSLIDGGEHFRGATESDVVDAWREMRRQFGTNTQNKLKARTAMRDWLRKKRNVSPESVVWYGDFVAVRSCEVRTRRPDRARKEDGWFLAVDPNRSGYRDSHIFDEAFVARSTLTPGAVEELVAPAWLSEAVRDEEAVKVGKGQARPFVPGSIDALTAEKLERGEVA